MSSDISSPSSWRAKDHARTASYREQSKATTHCDSGAPTVMCRYEARDGTAVTASNQPKRLTAP
jgi:hypothetical protein